MRHEDLRHEDLPHQDLPHQDLRHQDLRHQDLRHQDVVSGGFLALTAVGFVLLCSSLLVFAFA
jgi:hypothetical protein